MDVFLYLLFHGLMHDNHRLVALHNCVCHSFPYIGQIVAYLSFRNKSLFTDSYVFNFASLTIQVQKCLSKFFSKCVCFVVRDHVVSTVSFIIHEIHHSRKNITNLFRFFLIFLIPLSLLNQFPNDNIAKIQLLMAGDIHPHPG